MKAKISRRKFNTIFTAGTLGLVSGCRFFNQFDVIIKNGTIVDGSGNSAVKQDLGIIGEKIAAIGDLKNATASTVIDATDHVLSPGFIDIHTHTDMELLVNPTADSKIMQGVTTEVSGNCGSSPFPLNETDFTEMDSRIFEKYGFHVSWRDTAGFLRALEDKRVAMNYATFTGHGDLRSFAVGKNDVPATSAQLKKMQEILARSMAEGSFGLSTGLEYAPGSYASTAELVELNKIVARHNGVYATHMRSEDVLLEEAVQEALQICEEAQVSLQISHLKACNQANWHKIDGVLETIERAAESGVPVKADRYPYIAYGTGLSAFLPLWSRQGTTEEILARLLDKTESVKIEAYTESRGKNIGGWDRVVISSCNSQENKVWEGKSILTSAGEQGKTCFQFIRDILVEEKNQVGIVGFAMDENNLKKVLASPSVMVGSDGNAVAPTGKLGVGKPHPRFYGAFPRVLGKYAREDKIFDLATAVKKMTSMPADKLGLKQRGLIAKDYFADIVVFNPETVIDKATFADPHQFAAGIEHVLVNGKLTVRDGKHTKALAGSVLRHS